MPKALPVFHAVCIFSAQGQKVGHAIVTGIDLLIEFTPLSLTPPQINAFNFHSDRL